MQGLNPTDAVPEIVTVVAYAATAVGVLFTAVQLFFTRRQGRTAFEDQLNDQYRKIMQKIPLDARLRVKAVEPASTSTSNVAKHFHRYFDLCNEQVFLRKQGRISTATWELWRDGIKSNMGRDAFRTAWDAILLLIDDKDGDFQELRGLVKSEFTTDPYLPPWCRWRPRRPRLGC